MSNKLTIEVSKKKLVASMSAALMFVGGTAFGLSTGNNAETGYLICVNKSTKAMSYPGVLKCPSGTTQLVIGAHGVPGQGGADGQNGRDGAQGPPGLPGPQGPAAIGSKSTDYKYLIATKDIVFDGTANSLAQGKRTVMAKIRPSNLPDKGYYQLYAHLQGFWSSSAPTHAILECYFQTETDYLAAQSSTTTTGPQRYGAASTEYQNWNIINLDVRGDASDYSLSLSPIYLVCATTGSISGLGGPFDAFRFDETQGIGLTQ